VEPPSRIEFRGLGLGSGHDHDDAGLVGAARETRDIIMAADL